MQNLKKHILVMHFVNKDSRYCYHIACKYNTNTCTCTYNTQTATPAPIYLDAATRETYNTVFFIKFIYKKSIKLIYLMSNLHNFSLSYNNY